MRSWLKTCVEKIDVFQEKEKGKEKERKSLSRGESKKRTLFGGIKTDLEEAEDDDWAKSRRH